MIAAAATVRRRAGGALLRPPGGAEVVPHSGRPGPASHDPAAPGVKYRGHPQDLVPLRRRGVLQLRADPPPAPRRPGPDLRPFQRTVDPAPADQRSTPISSGTASSISRSVTPHRGTDRDEHRSDGGGRRAARLSDAWAEQPWEVDRDRLAGRRRAGRRSTTCSSSSTLGLASVTGRSWPAYAPCRRSHRPAGAGARSSSWVSPDPRRSQVRSPVPHRGRDHRAAKLLGARRATRCVPGLRPLDDRLPALGSAWPPATSAGTWRRPAARRARRGRGGRVPRLGRSTRCRRWAGWIWTRPTAQLGQRPLRHHGTGAATIADIAAAQGSDLHRQHQSTSCKVSGRRHAGISERVRELQVPQLSCPVFFESTECERCRAQLGFSPMPWTSSPSAPSRPVRQPRGGRVQLAVPPEQGPEAVAVRIVPADPDPAQRRRPGRRHRHRRGLRVGRGGQAPLDLPIARTRAPRACRCMGRRRGCRRSICSSASRTRSRSATPTGS